jgi:multicomponent Na+:H+ antiporter subunit E
LTVWLGLAAKQVVFFAEVLVLLGLRAIIQFVLLLGFWFLMSGSIDWQHALVGIVITIAIMAFWRRPDTKRGKFSLKPLGYGLWLAVVMLVEIWKSAWHVAKIILFGQKIDPVLVWIDTPLQSSLGQVVLANCITLTPGTLTVSLGEGRLLIHALTPDFAQGLEDWRVHNLLKKMEGSV